MDGISFNKKSLLEKYDSTPQQDSQNLVTSGTVYNYVEATKGTLEGEIDNVTTMISSPFTFKGTSTYANLPASGNVLNDTYYVTDLDPTNPPAREGMCMYSWDGTAWVQSSMSQADYAGVIYQLKNDIADTFDAASTYAVGDVVVYLNDNKLYVCNTTIDTPHAFNPTEWDEIKIVDYVDNIVKVQTTEPGPENKIWLNPDPAVYPNGVQVPTMDDICNIVAPEYGSGTGLYSVGDYVIYNDLMYKCNTEITTAEVFDSSKWTRVSVSDELINVDNTLTIQGDAADSKAVGDFRNICIKTTNNIYNPDTAEDGNIAVNSSGKCLFYASDVQPYRGFIIPLTSNKNICFKFSYTGEGISNAKLACYASKPTSNNDTFVALAQNTASNVNGTFRCFLTHQNTAAYYVFAIAFTREASYDSIYSSIKNSLIIFETDEQSYNSVDWDAINYIPHEILNVTMYSMPSELMTEIDGKVDKVEGRGLSENDFTDDDLLKLNSAYNKLFPKSEIIVKAGDAGIISGSWASTTDGTIKSTTSTAVYDVTPLIPCTNGDDLYLCEVQSLVFYKEDGTFSSAVTISSITGYTGNALQNNYTISDVNAAYMRVNFYNDNYSSQMVEGLYAVCSRSSANYKILNLGDSIFGLNPKPYDISSKIQMVTEKKTANCGFGGTRASTHTLSDYINFSLFNLADSIASGDWTLQDGSDFTTLGSGYYYRYNLRTLKGIDFEDLDIITLAYGTNDWNANIPLDNAEDLDDTTTFKGAFRYSINKIQTAYPKVMIVLLSPLYRTFNNDSEDSNTKTNAGGKTLLDYVDAIKEIAEEFELPFVDNYHNSGINIYNVSSFLRAGGTNNNRTHLTFNNGANRIGVVTGNALIRYLE